MQGPTVVCLGVFFRRRQVIGGVQDDSAGILEVVFPYGQTVCRRAGESPEIWRYQTHLPDY